MEENLLVPSCGGNSVPVLDTEGFISHPVWVLTLCGAKP